MKITAIAAACAVMAIAGCASTSSSGGTTAAGSGSPTAAAQASPAASASQEICTTRSCIAQDLDKALVGMIAQDESVSTRAQCKVSTVKAHPDQVWSARCTVTYTDGSAATGTGNLLVGQNKVTFTPDGA